MSSPRRRTGAAALVEALIKAGTDRVFGYPGANVLPIFDALAAGCPQFTLGRHEQGCMHMADGYARASGRPGVVVVTSGPGLTNTITGLGTAYIDGVPLVVICGQVRLADIGTDAFQEADTTGLTRSVSKHNFLVQSADEIPEAIAEAFYIATHGKPGPVVVDVPLDVQSALTDAPVPATVTLRDYPPECQFSTSMVTKVSRLLNQAKRPVIYVGGGVVAAGAGAVVHELSHRMQAPVVCTLMGLGAVNGHDQLSLGLAGDYGVAVARSALAQADVILALGVRFNDRVISSGILAKTMLVDCDAAALGRNRLAKIRVHADIRELLLALSSRVKLADRKAWLKQVVHWRLAMAAKVGRGHFDAETAVAVASSVLPKETVVVTDVGAHQLAVARKFPLFGERSFISSGGMGTMGFGIPAAIGAALSRPKAKVVAFVGDGGAQMTAEELIVAVEERLPILFMVFRNNTLDLVRRMRPGGAFATELGNPDFVLLAKAYGLKGRRVRNAVDLRRAITLAKAATLPMVIEIEFED